jgi:hypothetical protein
MQIDQIADRRSYLDRIESVLLPQLPPNACTGSSENNNGSQDLVWGNFVPCFRRINCDKPYVKIYLVSSDGAKSR